MAQLADLSGEPVEVAEDDRAEICEYFEEGGKVTKFYCPKIGVDTIKPSLVEE